MTGRYETDIDLLGKQVDNLLTRREYGKLVGLEEEGKHVWRFLQSCLYQTDENLRWHSIEAIGVLLRRRWDLGQHEKVLEHLRRLVWSISDESGGIGWSAPQAIAEIVAAIPQLSDPFATIMIDRSFNEPALLKGGLWGIGRLGWILRHSVDLFQDVILASFAVDDFEVLGLAAWATGRIGLESALPYLYKLKSRKDPVRIYISPRFQSKQIGSWAKAAIADIKIKTDNQKISKAKLDS